MANDCDPNGDMPGTADPVAEYLTYSGRRRRRRGPLLWAFSFVFCKPAKLAIAIGSEPWLSLDDALKTTRKTL
jgi:hypothetical protein